MTLLKNSTIKRLVWAVAAIWIVFYPLNAPAQSSAGPHEAPLANIDRLPGCSVETLTFFSNARDKNTSCLAFVPENGNPGGYPVLFLLHGAWDDYTAWSKHAKGRLGELVKKYRIIIVTPDGDPFGWYADSPYLKENRIETYFMEELIPHVDRHLPSNGKRAVAGLSMGGHGALVLSMRHPHIFLSASSMSGILDITRHRKSWKLDQVFGPYESNTVLWREHCARYLAEVRKEYLKTLPLLITVSRGDQWAFEDNRAFHEELDRLKIPHQYRVDPGKHDWDYWLSQLPGHVAFHAGRLAD